MTAGLATLRTATAGILVRIARAVTARLARRDPEAPPRLRGLLLFRFEDLPRVLALLPLVTPELRESLDLTGVLLPPTGSLPAARRVLGRAGHRLPVVPLTPRLARRYRGWMRRRMPFLVILDADGRVRVAARAPCEPAERAALSAVLAYVACDRARENGHANVEAAD